MPTKILFPNQLLTTVSQRVRIALPALNTRELPEYTITFPAGGSIGDESLAVSALETTLYAGERIKGVGGGQAVVEVAETALAGATSISILPSTTNIAANATGSAFATIFVAGCTDASPSSQPKTTDTTNFLSGSGSESAIVGVSRTLAFNFNLVVGDPGGDALVKVLFDDDFYDREIYAFVERSNGEIFEGAAVATTGSQTGPVQEKVTMQVNLQFQGESFVFTPAPTASIPSVLFYDLYEPPPQDAPPAPPLPPLSFPYSLGPSLVSFV